MKARYLVAMLLLNLSLCYAQEKTTLPLAQLRGKLKRTQSDTARVAALREIGTFYYEQSRELAYPYAIDSALFYVKKSLELAEARRFESAAAKAYLVQSMIWSRKKKVEESRESALKGIGIFTEGNEKAQAAKGYVTLADAEIERDQSKAVVYGKIALKLTKELGDKKGQGDALLVLGYVNMMQNKMEPGRAQLLEALELYKAAGYKNVQRLNALIAINYNQFGMRKEAVKYGLEAVRIIEERNDISPEAAEAYNYVAIIYDAMHEEQQSFAYLEKADKIAVKYNDIGLVIMLETNMVQMLMKFKRHKEALVYLKRLEEIQKKSQKKDNLMLNQRCILVYTALKDFKNAKKYVDRAMAISATLPPQGPEQFLLYPGIIKYHMETQQYDVARKYAAAYKLMAENSKNAGRLADIHRILFQLDSVQLRFDDALKDLKAAKDYEYAIVNEQKDQAFQELQVKYDSDKKDKDLLLKERNNKLLREQGELREAKLFQANLLKNVSFVGIALLIVILALLYRNFYIKQKNHKVLQLKNAQIDDKNSTLQKLADEREWLLREIHHRVKNNLQTVISLLSTQSHYLTDEAAMIAINSSQHRIHAMSLIHKKLYQSDNLVAIHMPTYIDELIEYFRISFDTGQRIRFETEIAAIDLDIAQAVPVGLILNEAITNAVKHAFPNGTDGEITITMDTKGHTCHFIIRDNGIGYALQPATEVATLGMRLIKGLTGDINGTVKITDFNGCCITISFPMEEIKLGGNTEEDLFQNKAV